MTFFAESEQVHGDCHDSYTLSIDSRDRNIEQFPNQNQYGIALPYECRNIRKVELRSVEFTETQYQITSTNNVVVITRTNGTTTTTFVTMKEGTYTGVSLAAQLTLMLGQATPTGGAINVNYDSDTGQLGFQTTGAGVTDVLNIATSKIAGNDNYSQNLMWRALGLDSRTADFTLPNTTAGETREYAGQQVNITPDRYLIMEITFPSILQGHMRTTTNHQQAFAKIIFQTDSLVRFEGFIQSKSTDFISEPIVFRNITRLEHIRFAFRRPNGDYYDFHDHNHSFTLRITTK